MIRRISLLVLLTSAVVAIPVSAYFVNQQPKAVALFDGETLEGWHGLNPHTLAKAKTDEERAKLMEQFQKEVEEHWYVEDGELVNDGSGAYLCSDKEFGDYELWVDYKTVAKADSGIYLRGTPQVQIWDFTEEGGKWDRGADKGSGGLWNNAAGKPGKDPSVLADKPFGEWNKFRIKQIGARTSVWLNGKKVVDHAIMDNYWDRSQPLPRKGPILLQTHGGEIRWKNIKIREIGSREANRYLANVNKKGFESVFNGTDLTGWSGATDNYEVVKGAIMCKPNMGGVLYTDDVYSDFVARLEFKLPPAGNNGLAIRYPGTGNAAYDGMTEIQILDSEHEKYLEQIDPRQAHGSAYGMVPASRGFLRETGEWNFQQVTVKGSRIKVELNGFVILDADLSTVEEYLDEKAHPGKELTEGHFGFAGHNNPVQFRNISIKRLKTADAKVAAKPSDKPEAGTAEKPADETAGVVADQAAPEIGSEEPKVAATKDQPEVAVTPPAPNVEPKSDDKVVEVPNSATKESPITDAPAAKVQIVPPSPVVEPEVDVVEVVVESTCDVPCCSPCPPPTTQRCQPPLLRFLQKLRCR